SPADTLVDLVKDQGWCGVSMRQHALERQHEACRFTAGRDLCHWLERFAGVGADQELDLVYARAVKGDASPIGQVSAVFALDLFDRYAEARPLHAQVGQFDLHAARQPFPCDAALLAKLRG